MFTFQPFSSRQFHYTKFTLSINFPSFISTVPARLVSSDAVCCVMLDSESVQEKNPNHSLHAHDVQMSGDLRPATAMTRGSRRISYAAMVITVHTLILQISAGSPHPSS